jgi:hypothetical protein
MVLILNGPIWFRGIDTLFTLIFAFVTMFLALMSYRAYKVTELNRHKYFSLSFILMSLGFLVYGIASMLLITHVVTDLDQMLKNFDIFFMVYAGLLIFAYTIMSAVSLQIYDKKAIALMLLLAGLFTMFSYQHYLKFHMISLVFLGFLAYKFYTNYKEKENYNAKLVFISFYLLAAAEVFALVFLYTASFYVVTQIIQLLGYLLLFYMLTRVLQYGREKREA